MDHTSIRERIDSFKELTTDKVKHHFIDFILDDLIDAGIIDYIISDSDWYFFWMDSAKGVKELIDQLLYYQHHYEVEKKDQEALEKIFEYLRESIEIKVFIDQKLRDSKHFNEYEVKDWMEIEVDKKDSTANSIPLMGNDAISKKVIKELHTQLRNRGFINNSINEFSHHFEAIRGEINKTQWLGTEKEIIGLFHLMIEKAIIPKSHRYKKANLIAYHFLNKKGGEFQKRQLGVGLSRVSSGTEDHLFIDMINIVEELAKIN